MGLIFNINKIRMSKLIEVNEPLYEICQRVYHVLSGQEAMVIDAYYKLSENSWIYVVTTGFECYEVHEENISDEQNGFLGLN